MHITITYWFAYYVAYFACCHFLHIVDIALHIILHIILHFMHIVHIRHIYQHTICILFCVWLPDFVHILHILHIQNEKSLFLVSFVIYFFTIAWSPIQGPSSSHPPPTSIITVLFYCRRRWESLLILKGSCPCQRVLSRSHSLEQEEGIPVWRRLEWHTRLVRVPCACRL
jgi:hypothetical protein